MPTKEEREDEDAVRAFRPKFWWLTRRRVASVGVLALLVVVLCAYLRGLYRNRHQMIADAAYAGDLRRVGTLLRWGLDPRMTRPPAINIAIEACNFDMLKLLADSGSELRRTWYNPVSLVAHKSADCPETAIRMLDYLVSRGADLNLPRAKDNRTQDSVRSLLRVTSPEVLRYFLARGVPPVQSDDVISLLDVRALRCEWRLILESGVDVNWRGPYGNTPLAEVERAERENIDSGCEMSDVEYARVLLENGADPNIPDNEGLTALDHAYERDVQNVELIALLEKHGAKSTRFKGAAEAASQSRSFQRRDLIRTYSQQLSPPDSLNGLKCDFIFRGQFGMETLISEDSWVLPLGQKREFDANCNVPSYLHFAVLRRDQTKDIPMSLNNRSNRGRIFVQFSERARNEELVVYHSASPIDDLGEALRKGQAYPFRRIDLTVWEGKD
ncbi:MAG: ankyrin repeat domain-containing protein [Myxococcales bacterium]|nr:ankyrin repeat domain-containing protein [Myxococcales bacterium]